MGWKMRNLRVQKGNDLALPSRSAPFFSVWDGIDRLDAAD